MDRSDWTTDQFEEEIRMANIRIQRDEKYRASLRVDLERRLSKEREQDQSVEPER